MKTKSFLVVAFVFILNYSTIAQTSDEIKAKHATKLVWACYTAWTIGNCDYYEPYDYIRDVNSQRIIAQRFFNYPKDQKYIKMGLNWNGNYISSINFANNPIDLKWNNDKISELKCQYLVGFNYTINYDEKGELVSILGEVFPNKKGRYLIQFEFADQSISKIIRFKCNTSGKSPKLDKIQTYEYKNNETVISCNTYELGKDPKPENITVNMKAILKKEGNSYISIGPYSDNHECIYNELDLIAKDKIAKGLLVDECTFEYINGKLSQKEIVKTNNNEFVEKEVSIYIVKSDLPSNAPDYEKVIGTYKFNKAGELIYEAKGGQYRNKRNGIWEGWKFFQY